MHTHKPHLHLRSSAFTLIEIVIVLTIISILAAGSIYMLKGNVDVAKETRVRPTEHHDSDAAL